MAFQIELTMHMDFPYQLTAGRAEPSFNSIDWLIRAEPLRSGSTLPTGRKPAALYKCIAGVSAAVTPKRTRSAPRSFAHASTSLSRARPAPSPRDLGSTHIWNRSTAPASVDDSLPQTRPQTSVPLSAKRARSEPEEKAAAIRADQSSSALAASALWVFAKASGESSNACSRRSRYSCHSVVSIGRMDIKALPFRLLVNRRLTTQ